MYADFIPKTDMKKLFNFIPERIKSVKTKEINKKYNKKLELNELHGISKSLDHIKEQINHKEERQRNKNKTKIIHTYIM